MKTDIDIAREAKLKPINDIAKKLDISPEYLYQYGDDKAKIKSSLFTTEAFKSKKDANLILVTAMNPTPAGEGKTTTSIGLADALNLIDKKTIVCLREPSLGPCFGMKGGAAGGGYSQVVPMEDINLHFTGDFHAITSAHNLLSALIDNHINWGNALEIDIRRITWKRVLDMNDRALRDIVVALGGTGNGFPRETGFDITVASEIMAIFCLATDFDDLQQRLGNIIVAYKKDKTPVYARDLSADGAMTVLLKHAFMPNLVQTLEHNPAFIHGGPFANIAHGCNSVVATKAALKLADYVVTEAGFGADLGAEKFFDIKCRKSGLQPKAVVLVATIRALKMHGGIAKTDLNSENVAALELGSSNLVKHIENLQKFNLPVVVAINQFSADTAAEIAKVSEITQKYGVKSICCNHWAEGGAGAVLLAKEVIELVENPSTDYKLKLLYSDETSTEEKINILCKQIYAASSVNLSAVAKQQLKEFDKLGYNNLPICMAKTQYSFSTNPDERGAPKGHEINVKELKLSAGAGFIVVICGDIMTMPGLPKVPAANTIKLDEKGNVVGLF